MDTETIKMTIPAFSAVFEETLVLTVLPAMVPRIEAIVATGATVYGERYQRRVTETLRDVSSFVRNGYLDIAEKDLMACQRWTKTAPHAVWMLDKEHGAQSNYEVFCDCGYTMKVAASRPDAAFEAAARHLDSYREPTVDELFEMLGTVR